MDKIDVTQSLHLSDHVPQIHPRGYFSLFLAHFFIFWVGLHLLTTSILIRSCYSAPLLLLGLGVLCCLPIVSFGQL